MSHVVPKQVLEGVIRAFDPVEVYLFGSQARGDGGAESDIDLYVVVDDHALEGMDVGRKIGEARLGNYDAVDIVVSSRSSDVRFRHTPGSIGRIARLEGVQLYAR